MSSNASNRDTQDTLSKRTFLAVLEQAPLAADDAQRLIHTAKDATQFWQPTRKSFTRFFHTQLLAYGVVLIAGAAVCFCAANWAAISGRWRLGLVAAAIALLSGLALRLKLSTTGGKASLTLAALFVGPLLAVYGQVFQTGADAYELFIGWALLMTPFALLIRWSALYLVQGALLQLAMVLFFSQVHGLDVLSSPIVDGSLALFNVALLAVFEFRAHRRGIARGVLHKVLTVAGAFFVVVPAISSIRLRYEAWDVDGAHVLLAAMLLLGYALWFHKKPRDVFGVTIVGASLIWATGSVVDQSFLHEWVGYRWEDVINGAVILTGAALLSLWLRRIYSPEIDDGSEDNDPFARVKDTWQQFRGLKSPSPQAGPRSMRAFFAEASVPFSDVKISDILSAKAELPIAVRVLLGFTIWIGAGMLSTMLAAMEIIEWPGGLKMLLAFVFFGGAAAVSRSTLGDLRLHLTIIFVVFAEVLVGTTLDHFGNEALLVLAAMQLLIIVCVRNAMTRLSATVLINILLTIYFTDGPVDDHFEFRAFICASVMAATAIALWLARDNLYRFPALRRVFRPIAFGMTLSALGLIAVASSVHYLGGTAYPEARFFLPVVSALLSGAVSTAVYLTYRQHHATPRADAIAAFAALAFALLIGAIAYVSASLAMALVFLPLGHLRREKVISVLATVCALIGGVHWYLSSHTSLLHKALVLAFVGTAFLVARFVLARLTGIDEPEAREPEHVASGTSAQMSAAIPALFAPERRYRGWFSGARPVVGVVLATALALSVPTGLALHKTWIIENGTSVLLELAPKDPRSIMQGDYMELRYKSVFDGVHSNWRTDEKAPSDGFVYLTTRPGQSVKSQNVWQVFSVVNGVHDVPTQSGIKIRYRKRNGNVRIAPDTYLFPEGYSAVYGEAKYAELRVSKGGTAVLHALYTKDFNTIEQHIEALPTKD